MSFLSAQVLRSASEKVGTSSAPAAKLSVTVPGTAPAWRFSPRRCAAGARGQFGRHRGNRLAVDRERQRQAADHAIGIAVDVQRADVASKSDRGALARRGQHRAVLILHFAEHDLAVARTQRESAQIIPVEAAQAAAEVPSPNGTVDCSIEVGNTMSRPTTLAPPSMIAPSTRAISGVQVTLGLPSKGGVRNVSSSSATTTAGEAAGAYRWPKDASAAG